MRFTTPVRVTSFLVNKVDDDSAPTVVKIFKDEDSMSFDNAADTGAT